MRRLEAVALSLCRDVPAAVLALQAMQEQFSELPARPQKREVYVLA
jgi:hypothetical protein